MINTLELCVDTALALCSTGPGGGDLVFKVILGYRASSRPACDIWPLPLRRSNTVMPFFFLVKFSFCFILEHREEIVGKGDD